MLRDVKRFFTCLWLLVFCHFIILVYLLIDLLIYSYLISELCIFHRLTVFLLHSEQRCYSILQCRSRNSEPVRGENRENKLGLAPLLPKDLFLLFLLCVCVSIFVGAQGPTKASGWNHGDCKTLRCGCQESALVLYRSSCVIHHGRGWPTSSVPKKTYNNPFLNCGSLLQNYSSWCQVDIQMSRHTVCCQNQKSNNTE